MENRPARAGAGVAPAGAGCADQERKGRAVRITRAIIPVILSVVVCAGAWGQAEPNGPPKWSFGQYYEPCQAAVEPNAPGYSLPLDVKDISNYGEVDAALGLSGLQSLIERNGFAVTERDFGWADPNRESMTEPYKYLKDRDIPLFVTTDTVLHLYHVQFDETLKDIEEREFSADIEDLTDTLLTSMSWGYYLLDGDLKEAARRNVAYLAVARKLINSDEARAEGPTGSYTPALMTVAETVDAEIALIEAHAGFAQSPLFIYQEDYSQYVPRGHYTRSEALGRYFKTMMWYGRMALLLKGSIPWGPDYEALISPHDADIQTLQALLLAVALRDTQVGGRMGLEVWDRLYGVTAFYVGLADDLTPYDYLWALDRVFQNAPTWGDLSDAANLLALKRELALLPAPEIFGGTGAPTVPLGAPPEYIYEILDKTKGLRLMGQRFIPDSYMFQHLVFPQVDEYTGVRTEGPFTKAPDGNRRYVRGYPRGLDVMALLGSEQARQILIDEGDTDYLYFWDRFEELKTEFDGFDVAHWNQNLYWSWLYSLKALLTELPAGYPEFMRTAAWQRRCLNATLASWTQLRHDTILYAKQSTTPAGRSVPPPPPPGYIEPVPEFFGRLLALSRMTTIGLTDMKALSPEALHRLNRFESTLGRMLDIANKELRNQPLTRDDETYLEDLPASLESLVTGVAATGLKTTLVADVHTNTVEAAVLEEAVGKVDLIVVACPAADGSVFLAVGPVLSYYEFKHPMADRLTDEAWRTMLDTAQEPARPAWYEPVLHP
jgi:hypothetical protein